MKKRIRNNEGITLVALVITIILLLILAGITIAQLTGSALFEKARLAEEKSENVQEQEEKTLADYENKIDEYISGNRDSVTLTQEEYDALQQRINELEEEVSTLTNNLFSSITYLKSTNTLVSSGSTAATENIELDAGKYILIASGKNSDYDVNFSLTGSNSIQQIGSTIGYSGSGAENVNGYHMRKRIRKINSVYGYFNRNYNINVLNIRDVC